MTTIDAQHIVDAGRLISWSARPKETPARHNDYTELVGRYFDDSDFAEAVHLYAAGLGLHIEVDRRVGVVAVAEPESPLRLTATDFHAALKSAKRKATTAAALLGVFRVAYPAPAHLDHETRVPHVSVADVVTYLNDTVRKIAETTPDAEAGAAELREVWRVWAALPQGRSTGERSSVSTQAGLVSKLCGVLEARGMLTRTDDSGEQWRGTQRLRIAARTLAEDSDIFAALLGHDPESDLDDGGEDDGS